MPANSVSRKTASSTRSATTRRKGRAAAVLVSPAPLALRPGTLGTSFASSFATSPAGAKRFVADLIVATAPIADRAAQAGELVHWASVSATTDQRHPLVAPFKD